MLPRRQPQKEAGIRLRRYAITAMLAALAATPLAAPPASAGNGEPPVRVVTVARLDQLDPGRWSLESAPQRVPLTNHDGAVYPMEVAPDGRLYFSDGRGIYRLAAA